MASPPTTPPEDQNKADDCKDFAKHPIRYTNGEILLAVNDMSSSGFGLPWGHTRMYDNRLGSDGQVNHDYNNGTNWMVRQWAYLVDLLGDDTKIAAVIAPKESYRFTEKEGQAGEYDGQYGTRRTLVHETVPKIFKLTQPDGTIWEFYDFTQTLGGKPQGALSKVTTPGGQVVNLSYNWLGQLTTVSRTMGSGASYREDKFAYTYFSSFGEEPHPNAGNVKQIVHSHKVGSTNTELRRVQYTYYGESDDNGLLNDLKTVKHEFNDGTWKTTANYYYRYYTETYADEEGGRGFEHGLKYVVGPEAYKRVPGGPASAIDTVLDKYADLKFEYDNQRRVYKEHVAGGSRTYEYDYTTSSNSDAPNHWKVKTIEKLPDGSTNTVYTNHLGQIMLEELTDGSNTWVEYRKYNAKYRLEERAEPSAIEEEFDDGEADLIPEGGLLYDSEGLIHVTAYYDATTATTETPGGVDGYVRYRQVKNGNTATPTTLQEFKYIKHSYGDTDVYPVAEMTVYQSEASNGSVPATTTFSYTWHADSTQIKEKTTTLPKIKTDHNGPGDGVNDPEFTRIEEYDTFGKMIRQTDARGSISLMEYDDSLGTLTKQTDNQGMLGHWKLDDGQNVAPSDSSGFGNAGTLIAFPSSVTGPSGDANTALDFDGVVQYVNLGKPDAIDVQPTAAFTLAAWIKVGTDESGRILAKTDSTNAQYELYVDTGQLKGSVGAATAIDSTTDVDDNEWHHVALVNYDSGSGVMKGQLYVDGVKKNTAVNSGTTTVDRDVLIAARRSNGGAADYLDGSVADVRIYNRALSVEEIGRLHDLSPGTNERVSENEIDGEGRVTQTLGPWHNIDGSLVRSATWTVYDDENHEVRTARGYLDSAEDPTLVNPVSITKYDEDGRVTDQIQATKGTSVEHTEKLVPGDAFTDQTKWTRWTSNKYELDSNDCYTGNLTSVRVYHTIPDSMTYDEGSSGTNYDETKFGYDDMNRQDRVETPGGTITRTVFEARGLVESVWVGTDDTPDAGEWAPDNTTDTDLVSVTEYTYDQNGNQTEVEQHVDDSTSRVTTYTYDWRDRLEKTIGEENMFQKNSEFDNLDRVTQVELYDGDGGTGQPGGTLIGRSETMYDKLGRVYQTVQYAIDASENQGNSLVDNTWYDCCDNQIKSKPAGSEAFIKAVYDGHGREIVRYVGYYSGTGGDLPDSAENDVIFEQNETWHDETGNVTYLVLRRRFDNAPATGTGSTGALQDADTDPMARLSYVAQWFDRIGRQTEVCNYGTEAPSSGRPDSPPISSDTKLVTSTTYNAQGEAYKTTDPAGTVFEKTFDDANRVTVQVRNVNTGTEWDRNQEVRLAYNADGKIKKMTAVNGDTTDQETEYFYDVTKPNSKIATFDLLHQVKYPDSTSGTDRVTYEYNRQGQRIKMTDQNETVHDYVYDGLGRQTQDKVTLAVGSEVDAAVKRIEHAYNARRMLETATSYDAATSGNVVNQVKFDYNEDTFDALEIEYLEIGAGVNTSTSSKVQYDYVGGSSDSGATNNNNRRTMITYPDGRVLHYTYGSGTPDDKLSRLATIAKNSGGSPGGDLAKYAYLGETAVVQVDYPDPKLRYDLTVGTARYADGLDQFDRTGQAYWYQYNGSTTDVVKLTHTYDRLASRLTRDDSIAGGNDQDEEYTYDEAYRLLTFARGTLSGGSLTSPKFKQQWDKSASAGETAHDPTGNWTEFRQDDDGAGWDLIQTRDHNVANETTHIDASTTHVAHDANGNMTKLPKPASWSSHYDLKYDAWNRLVKVEDGMTLVAAYEYDGLDRRTVKKSYDGAGDLDETRRFYYSDRWQVLEEQVLDESTYKPERQFVWGIRYLDDLVLRDRDTTVPLNGTFDETLYSLQDDNWNAVAITDDLGVVKERYRYQAFGTSDVLNSGFTIKPGGSDYAWEYRFTGQRLDDKTGLYAYRTRNHHPTLGRFINRDPLEYGGGINLHVYADNSPTNHVDPFGLMTWKLCTATYISIPTAAWKLAEQMPEGVARKALKLAVKEMRGMENFLGSVLLHSKNAQRDCTDLFYTCTEEGIIELSYLTTKCCVLDENRPEATVETIKGVDIVAGSLELDAKTVGPVIYHKNCKDVRCEHDHIEFKLNLSLKGRGGKVLEGGVVVSHTFGPITMGCSGCKPEDPVI